MSYSFVFDLGPPKTAKEERAAWLADGGVRRVSMYSVDVVERCNRDPSRWVRELPPGIKLGAQQGG
jgi:hypothetical protein